jgi:hypothetical protein
MLSGGACICAAQDSMICKPTTRLSVMLRDIPGLGVWRLESHGWNAAAELPDTAEFLARAGGYIGAWLYLKPQRSVKDGQTRDWMVPALEVEDVTPAQLLAGKSGGAPAIAQPDRTAIEAGGPSRGSILAAARQEQSLEGVREAWAAALDAGILDDSLKAELAKVAESLPADKPTAKVAVAAPTEPEPDPEKVWQDIVNEAGEKWTLSKLEAAFAERNDGEHPSTADGYRLAAFLRDLRGGWVEVPA